MSNSDAPRRERHRLPEGTIFNGRYEITGLLGEGGFATVYRARDVENDTPVALKVLLAAEFAIGDFDFGEFEMRFMREAKAGAAIDHPNLATIYHSGLADDTLFIAMELFEGHTLDVELETNGPIPPRRALALFVPAVEALGFAHFAGVVHRDLKPTNFFIANPRTDDEKLVILDFGVARVDDGDYYSNLTTPGQILGTPSYTAPEALKEDVSTPACDVYSVALLLLEMMTGRRMVEGESIYATMAAHVAGDFPVPVDLFTETPLGPVLNKALSLDPEHRYPDGDTLHRVLQTIDPLDVFVGAETMNLGELRDSGRIPPLSMDAMMALEEPEGAATEAISPELIAQITGDAPAVTSSTGSSGSKPRRQSQGSEPDREAHGSNPSQRAHPASGSNPKQRAHPSSGSNPSAQAYPQNMPGPPGYDSSSDMAAMSAAYNMQQMQQQAQQSKGISIGNIVFTVLAILAALGVLGAIVWFGFLNR